MQANKLYLDKLFYGRLCVVLLLLFLSTWLRANPFQLNSTIEVEHVEGYGFSLDGISITFDIVPNSVSHYKIEINSAVLPEGKGHIKDIVFVCNKGLFSKQEISCEDGELSFKDPIVTASSSPASFIMKNNGDSQLKVDGVQLAGGSASIDVRMQQNEWVAHINTNNVSLSKLHSIDPFLSELSVAGIVNGKIEIAGNLTTIQAINGDATFKNLGFTNQESTIVGEGVAAKFSFASNRVNQVWKNNVSSTVFGGELYFDPVFIDANESPKDIHGKLAWNIDENTLQLQPLHIEDQNTVHISITTLLDIEKKKPITPTQLNIESAVFPQAYEMYMQPFFLDTNLADMNTNGSLRGAIEIDGAEVTAAKIQLNRVSFFDKQKRFAMSKLDGSIIWGKAYSDINYNIGFDFADIYRFRLGETMFSFSNLGESLKLNQVVNVPILDGALNIESFVVTHPGRNDQAISMDLSLTAVSMKKVSLALGWSEMNGDLAGYAPNVTYEQGNLDVQGALLIRAFGGTTTIHNLKAKKLFSITPRLFADLKIQNLDLGSLTETFSFGEITGKLDGHINNLQFVSWQPTRFDAWLGTPRDDKSRHIISQKAVDSLTQIGNGASNIFSKSFLRILDSFHYDRIGIGCKLNNSACQMRGVSAVGQGFYIVKGSGIPRIDIIGYTQKVSWPVLTARLKRVVSTEDIVVQ